LSQLTSLGAGVPGVQLLCTTPPLQLVLPVLAHAPTPQVVATETKPSSTAPLQLSSTPSQVESNGAGAPATQLFCTDPLTQLCVPERKQAPTPQVVAIVGNPSSTAPLQLSSTLSQVASLGAGAPGVQLFCTAPLTQLELPERTHAPTPQVVTTDT
jgi:hypothetical protein